MPMRFLLILTIAFACACSTVPATRVTPTAAVPAVAGRNVVIDVVFPSTRLEPVFFARDKRVLDTAAQETCIRNADLIRAAGGGAYVVIVGYSDRLGNPARNLRLSRMRAEVVLAQYRQLGVAIPDKEIQAKGSNEPTCSERTAECARQNRRVDTTILTMSMKETEITRHDH